MSEKELPHNLCLAVLRRLDKAGILPELLLVGSWCVYFYGDYFKDSKILSTLRTRDIDFLVESPSKIRQPVDIPGLIADLGFIEDLYGQGYMRLVHPELMIDFLVPRKGNAEPRPVPLKALGVNAHALRFMDILFQRVVYVQSHGLTLRLPHPMNFAFHKLLISRRRQEPGKGVKDRRQAIEVFEAAMAQGEEYIARQLYSELPRTQRAVIKRELVRTVSFPWLT